MPRLRESTTAVIGRGERWHGRFATEPYECGWAVEAVVFLRLLEAEGEPRAPVAVQISPDGMHWVDEGTRIPLPARVGAIEFARRNQSQNQSRRCGFHASP